jgi:MraZ protein
LITIVGIRCKVDAKGRVLLPAPLKKLTRTFITKRFCFEAFCVSALFELYPMAEWDLMMSKINKLNRFVKKTMILYAGLRQV